MATVIRQVPKTPVIPVDRLINSQGLAVKQIPKNKEIVTLCAHGVRSQMAAQMLSKMGYNVRSIKGGMAAWNQVYDVAEVPMNISARDQKQLRIWQLRRVSKGCMSYIIASGDVATVVDCTCDLDNSVLKLVEEYGLRIKNVIDTHMHADHVSGVSMLVKRTGVHAYIGAEEGYELPRNLATVVNRIGEGNRIPVGDRISLVAIHTPGHTPGSMSFVLNVDSGTGKEHYLFTGDTIFVNGVGRPDLHDRAKEFAMNLYDTYQNKILKYPDDTIILPAHFDTSSITVKHLEPITDTIGSIKRKIKLLSLPKGEFVRFMVSSVPARPANYQKIIRMNKKLISCDQITIGDLEEGPNSCAIRM